MYLGCIIFKYSIRNLNSANNTQCGRDQASPRKKTLELCFRTMCFDVDCSCNFPKADECTSTKTTTVNNTPLRIGDSCLNCMVLNTRMNGTKHELEKLRGMLYVCRLYNRMVFNITIVCKHNLMNVLIN